MLNNPAVVPVCDASGIVILIDGVVLALVTVEVNVLPLADILIGFTEVTVPPLPLAVKVPPLSDNPDPIATAPGAASDALILPNNLPAVTFCIFA